MDRYQQINSFLIDSSFFYTIAIGMDSTYTFVSNNYNRNFDHSKGSLLGRHFSVTLHPDDIAVCEESGAKCFQHPGELFSATLRKHDGKDGFIITQWEMGTAPHRIAFRMFKQIPQILHYKILLNVNSCYFS